MLHLRELFIAGEKKRERIIEENLIIRKTVTLLCLHTTQRGNFFFSLLFFSSDLFQLYTKLKFPLQNLNTFYFSLAVNEISNFLIALLKTLSANNFFHC